MRISFPDARRQRLCKKGIRNALRTLFINLVGGASAGVGRWNIPVQLPTPGLAHP